jgi:hypothetical protein
VFTARNPAKDAQNRNAKRPIRGRKSTSAILAVNALLEKKLTSTRA